MDKEFFRDITIILFISSLFFMVCHTCDKKYEPVEEREFTTELNETHYLSGRYIMSDTG